MMANTTPYVELATFVALGGLSGLCFYGALWFNSKLYLTTSALLWPFLIHALRFGGLGLFFWWTATKGAGPLIASFTGHLVMRYIALRAARSGVE